MRKDGCSNRRVEFEIDGTGLDNKRSRAFHGLTHEINIVRRIDFRPKRRSPQNDASPCRANSGKANPACNLFFLGPDGLSGEEDIRHQLQGQDCGWIHHYYAKEAGVNFVSGKRICLEAYGESFGSLKREIVVIVRNGAGRDI